jgi:heme oxygenase
MTATPQQPTGRPADDFMTTDELLRRHRARPIATVDELAAAEDPFESNAEYDEFLADLYAFRSGLR